MARENIEYKNDYRIKHPEFKDIKSSFRVIIIGEAQYEKHAQQVKNKV
jgi:hypothetical protein